MTDTPELNVWTFEGCSMPSEIRGAEYAKGYQAAIGDVVKWLGECQQESITGHVLAGAAQEITRRFGKGQ